MNQRTAIILLLFCLIIASTNAQSSAIAISSGANQSTMQFEDFENPDIKISHRNGYFIGFAPSYQFNEKLAISVAFQYSQKGYKSKVITDDLENQHRITYIDIIPEINYYLTNFLSFGFGAATGIRAKEEITDTNGEWLDLQDLNANFVKRFDLGLTTNVTLNIKKFFVFSRYNLGIANIVDFNITDANGNNLNDLNRKNRTLQVGLGYKINM